MIRRLARTLPAVCLMALVLIAALVATMQKPVVTDQVNPVATSEAGGVPSFFGQAQWWNTQSGDATYKWSYNNFPVPCNGSQTDASWQALWIYPDNRPDLAGASTIARQNVIRASSIYAASAKRLFPDETSVRTSSLTPRWVTNSNCVPTVPSVAIPASIYSYGAARSNINSPGGIWGYMRAQGYTEKSRKYLLIYATSPPSADYSGLSEGMNEDLNNPNPDTNYHNRTGLASVNSGGTAPNVIAHEMAHNMGALTPDMPGYNPSNPSHAADCNDVMCYGNGQAGQDYNNNCGGATDNSAGNNRDAARLDCNRDDYFNSYSAAWKSQHWGVSASSFLWGNQTTPSTPPGTFRSQEEPYYPPIVD